MQVIFSLHHSESANVDPLEIVVVVIAAIFILAQFLDEMEINVNGEVYFERVFGQSLRYKDL